MDQFKIFNIQKLLSSNVYSDISSLRQPVAEISPDELAAMKNQLSQNLLNALWKAPTDKGYEAIADLLKKASEKLTDENENSLSKRIVSCAEVFSADTNNINNIKSAIDYSAEFRAAFLDLALEFLADAQKLKDEQLIDASQTLGQLLVG